MVVVDRFPRWALSCMWHGWWCMLHYWDLLQRDH